MITIKKKMINNLNPDRALRYCIVAEVNGQTHSVSSTIEGGDDAGAEAACNTKLAAIDAQTTGQ